MGRSRVLVLREPVEVRVDFRGGGVDPILCFTNHELVNAIMRCISEWPCGTVWASMTPTAHAASQFMTLHNAPA